MSFRFLVLAAGVLRRFWTLFVFLVVVVVVARFDKPQPPATKNVISGRRIISTRRHERNRFRMSREGTAGCGEREATGGVRLQKGREGTGTVSVFLGL